MYARTVQFGRGIGWWGSSCSLACCGVKRRLLSALSLAPGLMIVSSLKRGLPAMTYRPRLSEGGLIRRSKEAGKRVEGGVEDSHLPL